MVIFSMALGTRLTRIWIRDRRVCACWLYCARSRLARSVTVKWLEDAAKITKDLLTLQLQVIDDCLFLLQGDSKPLPLARAAA